MGSDKVLKELLGEAKKILKGIVENTTDPVEDAEEPGRITCGYCGRNVFQRLYHATQKNRMYKDDT